jgi:nucleolar pre-ribosomal-associated protein 1
MSKSAMFYEHSHEPEFWLDSLPNSCRVPGCEAPDGAPLTDEGDSVITFLDDCVQRFLKTPHRYLDQMHELGQQQTADTLDDCANMDISYPNPIFATLLEQLGIKVTNKLLSPSDVLAIACFIRKLLYRLSSELCGLQFLRVAIDKIDSLLCSEQLFPQFPRMTSAIRREVMMLRICLGYLQIPQRSLATDDGTVVQDLLSQAEDIPVRESDFHALPLDS